MRTDATFASSCQVKCTGPFYDAKYFETDLFRCTKCLTKTYCSKECWKEDWEVKHKQFCKKDPQERKVKSDSILRRQNQEEHCEEYKAKLSGHLSGAMKEEVLKVARSCQELEIKGKEDRRVKNRVFRKNTFSTKK